MYHFRKNRSGTVRFSLLAALTTLLTALTLLVFTGTQAHAADPLVCRDRSDWTPILHYESDRWSVEIETRNESVSLAGTSARPADAPSKTYETLSGAVSAPVSANQKKQALLPGTEKTERESQTELTVPVYPQEVSLRDDEPEGPALYLEEAHDLTLVEQLYGEREDLTEIRTYTREDGTKMIRVCATSDGGPGNTNQTTREGTGDFTELPVPAGPEGANPENTDRSSAIPAIGSSLFCLSLFGNSLGNLSLFGISSLLIIPALKTTLGIATANRFLAVGTAVKLATTATLTGLQTPILLAGMALPRITAGVLTPMVLAEGMVPAMIAVHTVPLLILDGALPVAAALRRSPLVGNTIALSLAGVKLCERILMAEYIDPLLAVKRAAPRIALSAAVPVLLLWKIGTVSHGIRTGKAVFIRCSALVLQKALVHRLITDALRLALFQKTGEKILVALTIRLAEKTVRNGFHTFQLVRTANRILGMTVLLAKRVAEKYGRIAILGTTGKTLLRTGLAIQTRRRMQRLLTLWSTLLHLYTLATATLLTTTLLKLHALLLAGLLAATARRLKTAFLTKSAILALSAALAKAAKLAGIRAFTKLAILAMIHALEKTAVLTKVLLLTRAFHKTQAHLLRKTLLLTTSRLLHNMRQEVHRRILVGVLVRVRRNVLPKLLVLASVPLLISLNNVFTYLMAIGGVFLITLQNTVSKLLILAAALPLLLIPAPVSVTALPVLLLLLG